MSTPCVNIFWSEEDGYFTVQLQAAAPGGGSEGYGEPIVVSSAVVDENLARVVIEGLEKYSAHVARPHNIDAIALKKLKKFFKTHKLVSVAKTGMGGILVSACEHRGVLFSGVPDGQEDLPPDVALEALASAIYRAFQKAT